MNKEILNPLNAIEASLDSLVRALTTTQTYAAGPKAARDLVKADDDLQAALNRLKTHQEHFVELQKLRAEADFLNAKLKDTVLTAVSLRKELGDIHPAILEDSDEEEEETNPVDYETLLAFATRIGKHNAIAAQEAEKLVDEQYLAAKKSKELDKAGTRALPNGIYITEEPAATITHEVPPASQAQQTQQVNEQISEFQNRRTWDRAQITTPFPNGELLRIGELGKLQIQKEQNGEDYADGHLEMLIKQSELKQEAPQTQTQLQTQPDTDAATKQRQNSASATNRPPTGERRPQERRPEAAPKKTLNLDFPDDDDDDDDDSDGN